LAEIRITICGIDFPNPVWTAAGPTGANARMMLLAAEAGAGGLVAKTLSVRPARVPIPNIASPFPGSLLNAEKWSEVNYQQFIEQELSQVSKCGIPVIASIGYTPEDLEILGRMLDRSGLVAAIEFSIHYIDKDPENLRITAEALRKSTTLPVLAKLSPAVNDIGSAVRILDPLVDGYVAINSLGPALDFNIETLEPYLGSEDGLGWLSGRAILPVGLHFVAAIAGITDKPVIGAGGIKTVEDVVKYLMAGASAVQICSAAILQGEKIYRRLTDGLQQWMDEHGYRDIKHLRGVFHTRPARKMYYLGEGPQLYPVLMEAACTFCDLCVRACMYQAIWFDNNEFKLDKDKCVSCGLCTTVCFQGALSMIER